MKKTISRCCPRAACSPPAAPRGGRPQPRPDEGRRPRRRPHLLRGGAPRRRRRGLAVLLRRQELGAPVGVRFRERLRSRGSHRVGRASRRCFGLPDDSVARHRSRCRRRLLHDARLPPNRLHAGDRCRPHQVERGRAVLRWPRGVFSPRAWSRDPGGPGSHARKPQLAGRGQVGKTAVVGVSLVRRRTSSRSGRPRVATWKHEPIRELPDPQTRRTPQHHFPLSRSSPCFHAAKSAENTGRIGHSRSPVPASYIRTHVLHHRSRGG